MMRQSMRWFGPDDPVSLDAIRQSGATDVVSALHHVPIGDVWPLADVLHHKALIENGPPGRSQLYWSVVESIPVHDNIKRGAPGWERYADAFIQSMRHVREAGIQILCYNFMPVIDWTRTDLGYELPNGGRSLRFDAVEFAAFDIFILEREGAAASWSNDIVAEAQAKYAAMSDGERAKLAETVTAGLPGRMTDAHGLDGFRETLAKFDGVDANALRGNLIAFLEMVLPVAEEIGMTLAIHPDDPPRPLLGLPRVVSTADDLRAILNPLPSKSNGITLCTGCYGVLPENDLPAMAREFAGRVAFAHLRGTTRDPDQPLSFIEADHLDSDIDMLGVLDALSEENAKRDDPAATIVYRPDHGHQLLDDLKQTGNPGYSAVGRLKGLAELRGALKVIDSKRS